MRRRDMLVIGAGLLAAPTVQAQGAWPTRPVRLVVPYIRAPRRM
jgi:tripartite-type tricarboxylate transporter receptor subunit TctC